MARGYAAWGGQSCIVLVLASCVGLPPAPPAGGDTSTGVVVESSSSGPGMTSAPVTTSSDTGDSGSSSLGSATTTTTEVSTSEGVETCAPVGALGDPCSDPVCDCFSGNCYTVGLLGGVCSECDESADCKPDPGFGCNFGNPLTMFPAVCSTTGAQGESCETVDDCADGFFCPTLIDVPGILKESTCSVCEGNAGCVMAQICTPSYDIANIGGYYYCAAPASVPNGQGCNLTGGGSECASGQCAPASLMGIPVVAVCSPCNEDIDCGNGMACVLPEIAIDGNVLALVPGVCA